MVSSEALNINPTQRQGLITSWTEVQVLPGPGHLGQLRAPSEWHLRVSDLVCPSHPLGLEHLSPFCFFNNLFILEES